MAPIFATFRVIVTASLLVIMGVAGICPCTADVAGRDLQRKARQSSHVCRCVLKTGHCCCGTACQCGQQVPQKDNKPAIPSTSNDRGQPLGLVVDAMASNGSAAVAYHAHCCPALLASGNLSLVAQGTRLNC